MSERVATPVCYRHPDRPTRLSCTVCERPICVECSHDAAVGQRCPEHARNEGRHRGVDARRGRGRFAAVADTPFVKWTMIVTVGIYALSYLSDFGADRGASDLTVWLYNNLAHHNASLADGELWRMVTHALLHSRGSLMHILFNMYALYLFGPTIERRVGSNAFAGMYIGSAAAGSAAAFVLGDPNMVAVGASGAIFGLFGAWLYVSWRLRSSPQGRAQFNQLAVLLAINLALPFIIPNVAWEAHVGGLVGGLLIAWSWSRWAVGSANPESRRTALAVVVLVVSIAIVTLG